MKISEVPVYAAAMITASATLSAICVPRVYSPLEDPSVSDAAISSELSRTGVGMEINPPDVDRIDDPHTRGNASLARFIVAIYESPTLAHSPSLLLLQDAVIEAIEAQGPDRYEPPAVFERSEKPFLHERGYILTLLEFSKKVRTK